MEEPQQKKWKDRVHVGMSVVLLIVILVLNEFMSANAIEQILTFASFTYGPLIGIFAFGIFTKRVLNKDKFSLFTAIAAIVLTTVLYVITNKSKEITAFFELDKPFDIGFKIGAELIIYNAIITFVILWFVSKKKVD